ncbi:uncharacterized protein LOC110100252 [Dendrobium catenatum]|uniref:uncharacterized protein LOC110100252 n=1 Tax=Dendrobium catenatum TaxID=906689 RepID=UPI0009F583AF|nr:uncharacterized protein LOC110100252 [Dendrobium catenatum]
MEEVLSGEPWFIGNHIIGIDKRSTSLSPELLRGLMSPVWIRFPFLHQSCWDEENIARIASTIGTPFFIDGNSLRWGKREYARVCVRINLHKKFPKGVWIEGIQGRTYQKVEYEKMTSLCYHCRVIGHSKASCLEIKSVKTYEQSIVNSKIDKGVLNDKQNEDIEKNQIDNDNLEELLVDKNYQNQTEESQANQVVAGKDFINKVPGKLESNLDITIAEVCVNNKFQVLLEEQEEGEITEVVETGEINYIGNAVQTTTNAGKQSSSDRCRSSGDHTANSGKSKLSKEVRSLGPVEATHRMRKGDSRVGKKGGDSSPLHH